MSDPSNAALAAHLRQYEGSSDQGERTRSESSCWEGERDAHVDVENDYSSSRDDVTEPSLLASSWPGRGRGINEAVADWWHRFHPVVIDFVREYGAILVAFLLPFTPRAARRAGYRGASHHVSSALDQLDARLPGEARGWSDRWFSRPRRRRDICRGGLALDGKCGGVGVATTGLVVSAVLWCTWRRSSPTWTVLLLELACGSTWVANYVAHDDGHREAKILEDRLIALKHSLFPFFRSVKSCMRMVKCSQALSFGLHLSVPMPPIARMEGRLNSKTGNHGPMRSAVALRELRAVLADVLDGAVERSNVFGSMQSCIATGAGDGNASEGADLEGQGPESESSHSPRILLAAMSNAEKQVSENLRCFVAELADRVDKALTQPEKWGIWWESQLLGVSEEVRGMVEFFEAASQRLEIAMGSGCVPFAVSQRSSPTSDVATVAETLSALRLRYEETVVQLYSCQSRVSAILRDPAGSTQDAWADVRHKVAGALESTRNGGRDEELWSKAENLIDSLTNGKSSSGDTEASPSPVKQDHLADASRHLETGVGWVSLTTSRRESRGVFEGGGSEEYPETESKRSPVAEVTDVLVGVASPIRSRREGADNMVSRSAAGEVDGERAHSQLLGELGSVLRARPAPLLCKKRLPLESQQSLLGEEEDDQEQGKEGHEADGMEDITPSLATPPPKPAIPHFPVCENVDNQDMMSELRAQLSMAANEEIFASDRDHWAVDSDGDGDESTFVQPERDEVYRGKL